MLLPPLVICNQSGFKNELLNTNLEDFKRNTIALDDVIFDNTSIQHSNHSINFTIETVYSAFRGRCYAIKFKKMMDKNLDFVDIGLKGGQNLHLYTLEPGFEKLLTFEFWINKPMKLEMKKEYNIADLYVTKEIIMQESNDCDIRNSHEYIGK